MIMKRILSKRHIALMCAGLSLSLHPCLLSSSEPGNGTKSGLIDVIKNIKNKEKSLMTFTARMVQTRKTSLLKEPLRSEGLIYFEHTGKILLNITSPSQFMILIKKNTMLIYHPDLPKVEKRYLGNNILKKYFGIGQSIEELHEQYSINLVNDTSSDTYHLKLMPKINAIARHVDSIEVFVSTKHWLPVKIYLKESEGDWTSIELEFISINKALPPDIFIINLPEDYENDF